MRIAATLLKAPIILYRYTLSGLAGRQCRHLPTCSDYALQAIDRHGAWAGGWLAVSRICRCNPWGTSGFDPVPRMTPLAPWWAPWRLGRWRGIEPPPEECDHPAP
ncbi:MAG: membrane protein insertion efficiency factor YidD [Hyphomicrobiaceae bacterium]